MNREHINQQIIEEASAWFVEINEGNPDEATRAQFHSWLALSPEHVRAYLKILPVWEEGSQLNTHANGDSKALIAWARAGGGDNVIPLATAAPAIERSRARRALRLSLAASVLLAAGVLILWFARVDGTYATDIGEQRLITLSDGSRIELNAASRIRVRLTERLRSIELLEGQALFRVAKDQARPFLVHSGDTEIRAVGTQFDVNRKQSGTTVTVLEGRVAVTATPESPDPMVVDAGEQLTVAPAAISRSAPANIAAATAWARQRLVFSRTPLPEVAAEFNRHNRRQLIVQDDALKTFNVSGTFSSTDPSSLIRFLRAQPELRVQESESQIVITVATF